MRRRTPFKEIKWSTTSILNNVFALWNFVVGEPYGIKVNSATILQGNKVIREFYSWQSLFIYWEHCLYRGLYRLLTSPHKLLKDLSEIRVYVPQFSGYQPQYPGYVFATAAEDTSFDTIATTGTSFSFAHVVASGEALIVGCSIRFGSTGFSSVQYNSSAMTLGAENTWNQINHIYYHTSPSTGTNNVTATVPADNRSKVCTAVSISGADTSDFIEATSEPGTLGATTGYTHNLTTTVDDSFAFAVFAAAGSPGVTTGAGQTNIYNSNVAGEAFASEHCHSYKILTTAGANTISATWSSSGVSTCALAVNAAAGAPAAADNALSLCNF